LYSQVPNAQWTGWESRYDNDCERGKRACRDLALMPAGIAKMLRDLQGMASRLQELTHVDGLKADHTLHGGGLHVTDSGGHLSPHIDYARHPIFPDLERRVNLVLFLNPVWQKSWGGAFELWDPNARKVKASVEPAPGRAVAWLPSDTAFHGTQLVAKDAEARATLAVYYLAPARPEAVRTRALFVPNRGMS